MKTSIHSSLPKPNGLELNPSERAEPFTRSVRAALR